MSKGSDRSFNDRGGSSPGNLSSSRARKIIKESNQRKAENRELKGDIAFTKKAPASIEQSISTAKKDTSEGRKAGQQYATEFFNRPETGFAPEHRAALQNEANKHIQSAIHHEKRRTLGDQASRGISRKSGVAYAQNRDINKQGMEAYGTARNEIAKQNAEHALKKQAAKFNIEQGEAAQYGLHRAEAENKLKHEKELAEQKRQTNSILKRL